MRGLGAGDRQADEVSATPRVDPNAAASVAIHVELLRAEMPSKFDFQGRATRRPSAGDAAISRYFFCVAEAGAAPAAVCCLLRACSTNLACTSCICLIASANFGSCDTLRFCCSSKFF